MQIVTINLNGDRFETGLFIHLTSCKGGFGSEQAVIADLDEIADPKFASNYRMLHQYHHNFNFVFILVNTGLGAP